MMILTHMTYIDETFKLIKGQGQRSEVKFTYAYAYFVDNSLSFEVHSLAFVARVTTLYFAVLLTNID